MVAGTLGFAGLQFKKGLVNYVSFKEAGTATDTTVQIMGAPVPGSMGYNQAAHTLTFSMADGAGSTMPIVFSGPKPDDLNTAMSKGAKITAVGSFDPKQRVFVADDLRVKCPSKYQGGQGSGREKTYPSA